MKVRGNNRTEKGHRGCLNIKARLTKLKMDSAVKVESTLESVAKKLDLLIMKGVGRELETTTVFATVGHSPEGESLWCQ